MATLISETKTNILFKRYFHRSSTDSSKEYYLENENPEAYNIVLPKQVYTQGDEIPTSPPADLISFSSGTDDASNDVVGSYVGKTSSTSTIIKKYIQIELQEIPSSNGKAFQAPLCMDVSVSAGTPTAGMIIIGQTSGARGKVISYDGSSKLYFNNVNGYNVNFSSSETIQNPTATLTATITNTPENCLTNRVLADSIPFNFANGEYDYTVFNSVGDVLYPSNGEWIIDNYSGILTFYGTLPTTVSSSLLPKITFYRYIGKKGFNTTHTTNGRVGLSTTSPRTILDINSTDALTIPVGTTAQRPSATFSGMIRYNDETLQFEGSYKDSLGNYLWQNIGSENLSIKATTNIGTDVSNSTTTLGSSDGTGSVNLNSGTFIAEGKAFYFSQSDQDGDWRIVQATDGAVKVLRFEQKVGGVYQAKQIFEG